MTNSGTELVTNLNADMIDNVHLSGLVQLNQVNVQFSTDNGATWNPVRFKP
jgi:hypothetical protein